MHQTKLPATPNEYFETYTDAMQGMLTGLASTNAVIASELQLDVTPGDLVADYFIACYDSYVEKYDPSKGIPFNKFCYVELQFRVRRALHKRTAKANDLQLDLEETYVGRDLEPFDVLDAEEAELAKAKLGAKALGMLKKLDKELSFVVWNHACLGFTYEQLADHLGTSRTSVQQQYRGAIQALRRLMAEEE